MHSSPAQSQTVRRGEQKKVCTLRADGGRVSRLDKKSGEQGDALDECDAESLLDPELVMVKIIGGLMMSKLCHGKGRQGRAVVKRLKGQY